MATTFLTELTLRPRTRSREVVLDPAILEAIPNPEPPSEGQRRNLRPLPLPTVLANLRALHAECVIANGHSVHACGLPAALQRVNADEWDLATYLQLAR